MCPRPRTTSLPRVRIEVASGAAASGEPWQHYDLGHGYCGYTFFEQCPHRMAWARCDFYTPKDSAKAQLLEARSNLQKMTAAIPLTDGEQASRSASPGPGHGGCPAPGQAGERMFPWLPGESQTRV
jgi:hypothetical protein